LLQQAIGATFLSSITMWDVRLAPLLDWLMDVVDPFLRVDYACPVPVGVTVANYTSSAPPLLHMLHQLVGVLDARLAPSHMTSLNGRTIADANKQALDRLLLALAGHINGAVAAADGSLGGVATWPLWLPVVHVLHSAVVLRGRLPALTALKSCGASSTIAINGSTTRWLNQIWINLMQNAIDACQSGAPTAALLGAVRRLLPVMCSPHSDDDLRASLLAFLSVFLEVRVIHHGI
jgi:hypothetical protein